MKVQFIIENLQKKVNSSLTENEKKFFERFLIVPDKLSLTYKKIYTVLGIDYSEEGYINFILVDDNDFEYPQFYPAEFFKIIDNRTSKFWINRSSCFFPMEKIDYPNLVTFKEMKNNPYFLQNLLENKKDSQKIFKKNKLLMELEFPDKRLKTAEVIDNNWLLCSYCDEVWESTSNLGIVLCPQKKHLNNNPLYHSNFV